MRNTAHQHQENSNSLSNNMANDNHHQLHEQEQPKDFILNRSQIVRKITARDIHQNKIQDLYFKIETIETPAFEKGIAPTVKYLLNRVTSDGKFIKYVGIYQTPDRAEAYAKEFKNKYADKLFTVS